MRVWLVVLLLALVAVVMVSARRGRPGRQGAGGRRQGAGVQPEREGEEGESGDEVDTTTGSGRRRWRPRPGRRGKGSRTRPGTVDKKKKKKGLFEGSMAMKKCGMCVLKCKKMQHKTFEQCLSNNQTTPCYGMCANATENMPDCLDCIGECRGTTMANGMTPNAWYCVKAGPCKDRCKTRRRPGKGRMTTMVPEVESQEVDETPAPPAASHWYSRFF